MTLETPTNPTDATAVPEPAPVLLAQDGTPAPTSQSNGDLRARIHGVAAMAHEAIDKLEQRLGSNRQGLLSTGGKGGEQARHYGNQLRERVTVRPMQSIGIALGAGFVLATLFGGKPKVHVDHEPEPRRSRWDDVGAAAQRRTAGLVDAARSHIERLGEFAHAARERVGETAGRGLEQTQGMASGFARTASAVPAQVGVTMDRLVSGSQAYGGTARSAIQAHPAAGLGAALGFGALVAVLLARR